MWRRSLRLLNQGADSVRLEVPTRVSWFELFYDLVIVASFAHAGHLIVNDLRGDRLTMSLGVWLVSTNFVTFTLWFSTSASVNIAPGTISLPKTLICAQMFFVTVANLALSRSDGLPDDWGSGGLALCFATVTIIYMITGRQRPELRLAARPWVWSSAAAATILAAGVVIPHDMTHLEILTFALSSVFAVVPLIVVGIPRLCRMNLVEPEHLAENVGQLVSSVDRSEDLRGANRGPSPAGSSTVGVIPVMRTAGDDGQSLQHASVTRCDIRCEACRKAGLIRPRSHR